MRSDTTLRVSPTAPRDEHLARLLAFALSMDLAVPQVLPMPTYHPTIEEGLRTALKDAAYKPERRIRDIELMRRAEPPVGGDGSASFVEMR